ncbi:hypothetical protein ACIGEP_15490 [Microbacterium sp. NPDC077663]|uniref:hypothetical protein n=1 Tax=Microbacterium sp. NPDC077663 TaxID=3364189 RepID=UPI0037C81CC9
MTEPVLLALISSAGLIGVALVTAVLAPVVLARLKSIEQQVANDHRKPDGTPLNLRDDLDTKHDENKGIMLAIQRDVAWLMRQQAETDHRLDSVEDTLQGKRKQ